MDAASWEKCFHQLSITGMSKQLAGNCELYQRDGDKLLFHLEHKQRHFLNDDRQGQLQQAMTQWLAKPVTIHIDLVEQALANTPMQLQKLRMKQRLDAAQQALEGDALLQEFIHTFDANIVPGSVLSVDKEDSSS